MSIEKLKKYAASVNVATELSEQKLQEIGDRVLLGFREDFESMSEWLSEVKQVEELASLVSKKKSTPLPNSANVKLPIITKAVYEFSSTTLPEIIKDDKIVQAYILGKDFEGTKALAAKKATDYMNYQLLVENQEWQDDLDTLFTQLGLVGFLCKKTYYDPVRQINKSVLCDPKELIINAKAKSLSEAARISQIIHFRLNDFVERKNKKVDDVPVYLAKPVEDLVKEHSTDELDKCIDIIEQHCKLDLDDDGLAEPYIVTILKEQGTVLRIAPRFTEETIHFSDDNKKKICYIDPTKCFVDFHFLKSPKGHFQSVGFGLLLLQLNESANSIMNQLLDSGQLANMRGGYKDARLKIVPSGNSLHDPGEWKDVKVQLGATLKDGMVPIDYKEPSSVLYQLLSLLIDVSRDLTSSMPINTGTQSSENAKTGATLAIQNEGKKIMNSIHKGIYRSLTNEFVQLAALNYRYLDKDVQKNIVQDILEVSNEDFNPKKVTMFPVADPTLSSSAKKMQEAAFVQGIIANPGIDPKKATKFIVTSSGIPDIEQILMDEKSEQPPNPEAIKIQAEIQDMAETVKLKQAELELKKEELKIKAYEIQCACLKMKSEAIKNIATAESLEAGQQMESYTKELDMLSQKMDADQQEQQRMHDMAMQSQQQQHEQMMQQKEQEAAAQQAQAKPAEAQ
jgi:chaperonin GroES